MLRKLWVKWCKTVDEHNEPLDNYVFGEEMWTPYTPLVPLITAFIISTVMIMAAIFFEIWPDASTIDFAIIWFKTTILQSIVFGLFFTINWIVFSDKKDK